MILLSYSSLTKHKGHKKLLIVFIEQLELKRVICQLYELVSLPQCSILLILFKNSDDEFGKILKTTAKKKN